MNRFSAAPHLTLISCFADCDQDGLELLFDHGGGKFPTHHPHEKTEDCKTLNGAKAFGTAANATDNSPLATPV